MATFHLLGKSYSSSSSDLDNIRDTLLAEHAAQAKDGQLISLDYWPDADSEVFEVSPSSGAVALCLTLK